MAPELVSVDESKGNDEDQYDEKIDIWAIGCIFHELEAALIVNAK